VFHLLLDTSVSGRLVALFVGLLVVATLAVRAVAGAIVRQARRQHRWRHRAVIYGSAAETSALTRQFSHRPTLGVEVVGACITDEQGRAGDAALDAMSSTGADLLAVAGGTSPAEVRALAWALEGTGAELLIAPAVPDLAQQRVVVQPVGGVVLLRVEQCAQRRGRLYVKNALDRLGAAALLVVAAPLAAAVAVAVKVSSPGPVLFRQTRVGQYGKTFDFLKFRTMAVDAEAGREALEADNDADGLLFKVRHDPRVTPIGRFLRRMSLDELPQLWNVVRGDMSLVGPRPLPVAAAAFAGDERRRFRVRPGITGLWQVSGRSDLGWEETVALDMHYVDHWSLGLDLAILARTPLAVLRGRGAY
jgi:exopolysaccharide biosynthesis polyprenyl glycosylphosphotransferase